ncbi:MAG: hypothetical protein ABIQ15_00175 [Nocardioides sp.]
MPDRVPGLPSGWGVVARRRPVDLVSPTSPAVLLTPGGVPVPAPQPAPYAALVADLEAAPAGRVELGLRSAAVRLTGWWDAASGRTGLTVDDGGRVTEHRSRRWGRAPAPPHEVGLTLTGTHVTVLTRDASGWTARGRVDLAERVDTRSEEFCGGLAATVAGDGATAARVGGFGQLGLRDLRFVTDGRGALVRDGAALLLTATHAGPGFFGTAHTGVWALDPLTYGLSHRADLFFRRPDRPGAYGDHSTHLVRDDGRWLVATSTWGDFDLTTPETRRRASVRVTLAETDADLTRGRHLLDTRPLPLPVDGLASVAVWDPHLLRHGDGWLVGYVSAPKFFRFHPVVAAGPTLDDLTVRSADRDRRATEGTTFVTVEGRTLVLASDGRDGRRGQRRGYPVFDLDLAQVGALDAPYPSNLPWPNLAHDGSDWLLVTFDGTPAGGSLLGYGTHGDVVVMRTSRRLPSLVSR